MSSYSNTSKPYQPPCRPLTDAVKQLLTSRVRKALALLPDDSRNKVACLAVADAPMTDVALMTLAKAVHEDMQIDIKRIEIAAEVATLEIIAVMNELQAARTRAGRELRSVAEKT